MIRRLTSLALLAAALPVAVPVAAGAQNRSADFQWAKALSAGSTVSIHNVNGDIKVVPSTSGRVEVVGIKRGSGAALDHLKAEVKESSRGVTICVMYDDTDSYCDENGMHSNSRGSVWNRGRNNDRDWNDAEMRLEVSVPANLLVEASSVSGDVSVTGAHGDVSANSVSGDIHLDRLHASAVHANTVSGDVDVQVDEFTGRGDLSFHSVSGDVILALPRDFGADLSMSTVSGDIDTDFPLTLGAGGRTSRGKMTARIAAGGRRLDVSTVSGDLRLRTNK